MAQNNKWMIARSVRLAHGCLCTVDVKLRGNIKLNCVCNISPATHNNGVCHIGGKSILCMFHLQGLWIILSECVDYGVKSVDSLLKYEAWKLVKMAVKIKMADTRSNM